MNFYQKFTNFRRNKYVSIILFVILFCLAALSFVTTVSHFLIYNPALKFFIFPYISFVGAVYAFVFYSDIWIIPAFKSVRQRKFGNYNFMISFATIMSFLVSTILWAIYQNYFTSASYYIANQGNSVFTFYDAVTIIFFFAYLGEYLERWITHSSDVKLNEIEKYQPKTAKLYNETTQVVKIADVDSLKIGDYILIARGDHVPIDGILISESALLEMSLITGDEAASACKQNDKIYSGTINLGNAFIMEVKTNVSSSYVAKLIKKLKSFNIKDSKLSSLANKIIKWIFIIEMILGTIIFLLWTIIGIVLAVGKSPFDSHLFVFYLVHKAIFGSLSLITAVCPCALGVTIPALVLVASFKSYHQKILFRNLKFVNVLNSIQAVAFDKTGTLSTPLLDIKDLTYKDNNNFYLSLLKSVEAHSNHPIANSTLQSFNLTELVKISNVKEIVGAGLRCQYENKPVIVANREFIKEVAPDVKSLNMYDQRNLLVYNNEVVLGFNAATIYKKEIFQIIDYLKRKNYDAFLITGDQQLDLNDQLWQIFDRKNIYFNVKPERKASILRKYAKNNDKKVLYLGDGLNDVMAFAGADLSIALGSGHSVLQSVADIVFLDDDLKNLLFLFKLLKYTKLFIKLALGWLFIYNVAIAFITGFALISPAIGAGLMVLSDFVLLLLVLGFRILPVKKPK